MSENRDSSNTLLYLLVGAAIGAAVGILFAPRSGRQSRAKLRDWAEDLEQKGEDLLDESRDLLSRGKEAVREKAEKVRETVETAVHKNWGDR